MRSHLLAIGTLSIVTFAAVVVPASTFPAGDALVLTVLGSSFSVGALLAVVRHRASTGVVSLSLR
jgi:hypothetical protein